MWVVSAREDCDDAAHDADPFETLAATSAVTAAAVGAAAGTEVSLHARWAMA